MNKESLLDLFDHMAWADSKLWTEVLDNEHAVHDTRLHKLLTHIHIVQRFYLRAWRNEPLEAPHAEFEQLPDLYHWAKAYYEEARGYLESLTDALLAERMPEAWILRMKQLLGPAPIAATTGDTVMQVILHGLHHRGQANLRLRELGGVPPVIDYIVWVWLGRPSAVWRSMDAK